MEDDGSLVEARPVGVDRQGVDKVCVVKVGGARWGCFAKCRTCCCPTLLYCITVLHHCILSNITVSGCHIN